MRIKMHIFLFFFTIFCCCNTATKNVENNDSEKIVYDSILKIEMNLSAFGVEADCFPSIDAVLDVENKTSKCKKWFYNPACKDSTYSLSLNEIDKIIELLKKSDLEKIKKEFSVSLSDQPTSTMTITTKKRKIVIKDYGLVGDYPLKDLYKIVYKY